MKAYYANAEVEFNELHVFRETTFVHKLQKTRKTLADQQNKLKLMRKAKVKEPDSIETKMFKVMKEIGVELSSYHGGSLNGKDIAKVMNNASHVFQAFATIFKEGKRPQCQLTDVDIDDLCLHFREVFVLWDGAFLLARTEHPTEQNGHFTTYLSYVNAAVHGSRDLGCTVTPKVHMMVKHVEFQMRNIRGGLGDKVEDWVERLHQTGIHLRQRFRTVKNPIVRALARDKAHYRNMHPDVAARVDAINEASMGNYVEKNIDNVTSRRNKQRDEKRSEAIQCFEEIRDKTLTWMKLLVDDANGVGDSEGAGQQWTAEDFPSSYRK